MWQTLFVDMKSLLSWQYLMRDIHIIKSWNISMVTTQYEIFWKLVFGGINESRAEMTAVGVHFTSCYNNIRLLPVRQKNSNGANNRLQNFKDYSAAHVMQTWKGELCLDVSEDMWKDIWVTQDPVSRSAEQNSTH